MPPFARREFSGNAVPTTLTSGIAAGDLTINIALATGWPTGATGPFIVTIDQGLATEEKIEIATRAGLVLTATPTGRGHDNTAAVGHGVTAKIEHTLAARDLAEANAHNADTTRDDHPQYFNTARHLAEPHAIDASEIVDGSITYVELAPGQRFEPGDFKWSMQPADHAGWLKMDGRNNLARVGTYAALFAIVGTSLGAGVDGNTFGIGDVSKKVVMGKAAAGVGSTLGGSGGSADSIAVTHAHVMTHGHTGSSAAEGQEHTHGLGGHVHGTGNNAAQAHGLNGANPGDVAVRVGGAVESLQFTGPTGTRTTFTNINDHPAHNHGNTGGPSGGSDGRSATHTHAVTVDNLTGSTQNAGAAGTDANLPPFVVMNGFIHV